MCLFKFLHKFFLNSTVKNYENRSTFTEVIAKIKAAHFFETRCRYRVHASASHIHRYVAICRPLIIVDNGNSYGKFALNGTQQSAHLRQRLSNHARSLLQVGVAVNLLKQSSLSWMLSYTTNQRSVHCSGIHSTKRYSGTQNLPGAQANGKILQSVAYICRNWSNPLNQTHKFFSTKNLAPNTALLQSGIISAFADGRRSKLFYEAL